MSISNLKVVYTNFLKHCEYINQDTNEYNFKKILKELEDTFIQIKKGEQQKELTVSFQNPSIRDFMLNYINSEKTIFVKLIKSCYFFDHLQSTFNIVKNKGYFNKLADQIERKIIQDFDVINDLVYELGSIHPLEKLHWISEIESQKIKKYTQKKFVSLIKEKINTDNHSWYFLTLLENFVSEIDLEPEEIFRLYCDDLYEIEQITGFNRLKEIYPDQFLSYLVEKSKITSDEIEEIVADEIEEIDDDSILEEYKNKFEILNTYFPINITRIHDLLENRIENIMDDLLEQDSYSDHIDHKDFDDCEIISSLPENYIDSMFSEEMLRKD